MQNIRFEKIIAALKKVYVLADIGSDHGFIPMQSVLRNIAGFAIASDISSKSLEKINESKCYNKISDRIDIRTGYGLETLFVDEADEIVITGMGADLICSILDGYEAAFDLKAPNLVLSSAGKNEILRKYLYENSFKITAESIVYENGIYYHIISCEKSIHKDELYDNISAQMKNFYYKFGPLNALSGGIDFKSYFKYYFAKRAAAYKNILNGQNSEENTAKLQLIKKELDFMDGIKRGLI